MAHDPSRIRGSTTRRAFIATAGAASAFSLAGCMDTLESAADETAAINTVAVESDQDGEFYHPTQENIEIRAGTRSSTPESERCRNRFRPGDDSGR